MSHEPKTESAELQPGAKSAESDLSRRRFPKISSDEAWVPGLIEVVFRDPTQSGVQDWYFPDEKERKEFSEAWPPLLRRTLEINHLQSWRPSFPLTYPWTKISIEKARENYRAEERDKFVTLRFPDDAKTRRIAAELRDLPELEQAVAVPRIRPPSGPLDEPFMGNSDQPIDICDQNVCVQSQWYIFRCNVDRAWQKKNGSNQDLSGKGVVIADIDWGFHTGHQDLSFRITNTQNILLNSLDRFSVNNGNRLDHGTAVLGLAGAEVNGLGIAGVAYGADLWAIQAGIDNIEDHDKFFGGIKFVVDEMTTARKVIILEVETESGGNIEMVPTINHEIKLAIAANIVVCVPAGDGIRDAAIGDDNSPIPITCSILVGATKFDAHANIRGISNFGCRVVVYAPGDFDFDVTCEATDDGYRPGFGGTSSAVAKVAGVVALMLEKNPALTHEQVRDILGQSKIPVLEGGQQIGVLLDAEQAVV